LLVRLVPQLHTAAESAPEGRPRWSCLCYLADALKNAGCPDAGLLFFEQAAAQARKAAEAGGETMKQAWADFGWITSNWANAFLMIGDLDAAHKCQLEGAEAKKKAELPSIYVIGNELEALRIEIWQGQAAQALPKVEAHLAQVQEQWRQHRAGQCTLTVPDVEILARTLIAALDIARESHFVQQDWEAALRRVDDLIATRRVLEHPTENIAGDRVNRAIVLMRLGHFREAQAEQEACLLIFQNDPAKRAKVLINLANIFALQSDLAEAVRQGTRALALCEQLPDPRDRALSHYNLASYLELSGTPSTLSDVSHHQLAALIYRLVAGLEQDLQTSLHNYFVRFRRAYAAGVPLAGPRITELLAGTVFRPLDDWLRQQQVNVDQLQAAVDHYLEMARQAALEQE
jgi:tetratricopeptide (TPR) repeat protein